MPSSVDVGRVREEMVASKQCAAQKGRHGVHAVHLTKLGILPGLESELGLHQASMESSHQHGLEGNHKSRRHHQSLGVVLLRPQG
jgi:hypothetical protein